MPELPEVETVVTTLRPSVVGCAFSAIALHRPDIVTPPGHDLVACLAGRRVTDLSRRAKRIVFTLDNGDRFYVHLGMTGQLSVVAADAALPPHTHFQIALTGGRRPTAKAGGSVELRFTDPRRFGGVWWLGTRTADDDLGPEPLTLPASHLARRLATTRRPIKAALLDQSLIAGLGNIYVDESLFAAGIHPLTPANLLSGPRVGRLSRSIKLTLKQAIRHRGSTLRDYRDGNGEAGGFQSLHRVYDRAGQPCRKCGLGIERIVLGGRSTHFCPACQKR